MTRFEHHAFVLGLGFVAGALDVFGFIALYGLLPAHVTGNLVLLAVDLARGDPHIGTKLAALPVFFLGVGLSAWGIGVMRERGREPLMAALTTEAALLGLCLLACLVLPTPTGADDASTAAIGALALLAMALQNTTMRLILNNLPPTTVMTGNITQVVSDTVAFAFHLHHLRNAEDERRFLGRQATRMALTLGGFAAGGVVAGVGFPHVGATVLAAPIAALLILLPFGRAAIRAERATARG